MAIEVEAVAREPRTTGGPWGLGATFSQSGGLSVCLTGVGVIGVGVCVPGSVRPSGGKHCEGGHCPACPACGAAGLLANTFASITLQSASEM